MRSQFSLQHGSLHWNTRRFLVFLPCMLLSLSWRYWINHIFFLQAATGAAHTFYIAIHGRCKHLFTIGQCSSALIAKVNMHLDLSSISTESLGSVQSLCHLHPVSLTQWLDWHASRMVFTTCFAVLCDSGYSLNASSLQPRQWYPPSNFQPLFHLLLICH